MRVAVTGASGFIGSALVPALRARRHEVRVVVRDALNSADSFAGIEVVVHLANLAHGKATASQLQEVNVEGTRRLARLSAATGARRMIYLSSIKALGEDRYGRSKRAAETALRDIGGRGLEIVVLRPPLVYGPGVKANFLALLRAIDRGWPLPFASIANRRSLLYVGNLCDAIERSLARPEAAGRTWPLSDGAPISTPALCRAIGSALGKPARLVPFPPALLPVASLTGSLEVDDAPIRSELGWRPPFSFEQGLKATADWYLGR